MQELKQIELKQAIGKSIKNVHISYKGFVIIYTDDTFSCFKEYDNWGSLTNEDSILKYEIFIEKLGIRPDGSTYFTELQQFLIDAGILDGNKLIEDAKPRIKKYVKEFEEKERREYERLKDKFEKVVKDF